MKELPILFNTEMVQAILAGRKTQTRRILKADIEPPKCVFSEHDAIPHVNEHGQLLFRWHTSLNGKELKEGGIYKWSCPYGGLGDILYVRETWQTTYDETRGMWKHIFKSDSGYWYDDDGPLKWKRAIHMPKSAARIWLQVTGIRVERVQDISEEDAMAEGIDPNYIADLTCNGELHDGPSHAYWASFFDTWQAINGIDSWENNPWVWVVSFQVLSTTGRPKNMEKENINT
ncbi:hypothetical protein [Chitinophaga nivalis]|uniref:Morphogenetic protein n=1 Tax=Chitinophaga nivalis TaxID=2991709 RepID=A0ABT3IIY4_9BACT|nr:hypothetical protein [Chitinophaga nivalis]MCW3466534.1 hypothetical protein [Chitinophaga nivalis]MCW3483775.1 hypothetical protein [Chitinophaga nivalis]